MLNGERRWASSTRRGGMTVLGKVAVPKPINLPSQRLENHGLDPNVEIVLKGSLSWGSKSPSSALNAWGSSVSPSASGGTSSPSQLSARPSSGGSGTRPSTSGSDRASELTSRAWGSNSRPSSSSGVPTSSQTSQAPLRPRSAETRPGSSELSRFAEHVTENSVAQNVARTTEKLGITQRKNDHFSLSSGDFPTLGSEKEESVHNFELQDHSSHMRPGSSAVLGNKKNETSIVDDVSIRANEKGETENSWRRDYQAFNEDGMRPGIEKWQGNLHHYPNAGILPQHFDVWRGAPVNSHQGDIWFRGPPNGSPFGVPVAPGGFPIEPFPFYRPHIPLTGLANPLQVPSPGSGPTGQHKNGEVYMPHMPDAYIPPGMPLRPGFYPGPMAYEGYYGPPMGYCTSNERGVPFMGMATGPSVQNRNPSHNPPEPGNSHGRSGGHGPAGKPLASEPVESSHTPDAARPYRVLLKKHNKLDEKNEPTNLEDSLTTNPSYANVRDQPIIPVPDNDCRRNMDMDLRMTSACGKESSSQTLGNQGSISVNNAKSLESIGNLNKFDNFSERKMDGVASNTLGIASRPSAHSILIQKIEALNAKARDNSSTKNKEERRNKFHTGGHAGNEARAGVASPETSLVTEVKNPTARGVGAFGGEKNFESSSLSRTATSRQISHGMQARSNHQKRRLDTQDADGGRKRSGVLDSSTLSGTQLETSNFLVGEHQISVDAYERSGYYSHMRREREARQTLSDSADSREQRVKTKVLSKQQSKQLQVDEEARTKNQIAKSLVRSEEGKMLFKQQTKQLQVDEEERIKKQKAKSLVRSEEGRSRAEAVEGSMQKVYAANSPLQNKQEEFQPSESAAALGKSGAANSSEMPDASDALQAQNNVVSKQRRSYKQKHNRSLSKTSNVSTTSAAPEAENDTMAYVNVSSSIVTNDVSSSFVPGLPLNLTSMVESSVNQKRKNNRNRKNKQKVEKISSLAASPTASSVENKPREDRELDQGSLQSSSLSKDSNQYSEQKYSENEEFYSRKNNLLKSQHSRRMPRNMQVNRRAEKFHGSGALVWAPVKPPNKIEILDESSEKSKIEAIVPTKSDQQVLNLKNKRAEMERYVPKPVAKEMAQQGSSQQMVSSKSQVPMDKCVERDDSGSQGPHITRHTILGVGMVGSVMESKNGDSRQSRAWKGKTHGSWWQRNSAESNDVHDMLDGADHGSNSCQNIKTPMEHQKVQISETRGQSKHANDASKLGGLNKPENHASAPVSVPIIKDHKATVRERRVPFSRQKGSEVNHVDQKKNATDTRKSETLTSSSVHNQPDINVVLKENRSIGEHLSSHRQPIFQASNNHRGNRSKKKEVTPHVSLSFPDDLDMESSSPVAQPLSQSVSEKSKGREAPNFGNPEALRESRNAPPKGHRHYPNQVAVGSSEHAPRSMDPRHQHYPSSGLRRNGSQSHFGKGRESQGNWKTRTQDDRYHNQERQGPPNFHYEHHSVWPHGDSKSDNSERPKDGNYHAGGRFRERGQTHSRRGGGNFSRH
ncbi:protein MODIFIER OF SNC1 1 isoform X2 [Medicago truncatula]|uniref:protein MODIFIER OF SNC1 1 isoform X2 n=1 Tax=Medicago truncatula TaxID=3880 RepID=UPI0019684AB4|nr:protein MODIFIER OF SNC1 1 isoform X2 [Medicago truncatula]